MTTQATNNKARKGHFKKKKKKGFGLQNYLYTLLII